MQSRDRVSGARRVLQFLLLALLSSGVAAQSPPSYVLNGPLLPLIVQAPENGWIRVNINRFQDVWTPDYLEPYMGALNRSPSRIIYAWSGFGWDSNRGDLILYGGGHANYGGNDVYRWHSSNFLWERASLPSDIYIDPVIDPIAGYQPIDGVDHAPVSAHTYQNNGFLPIADRFIALGGAAWNTGGPYQRRDENNPTVPRLTGPFLFDPNKANGNEVGGTTGSNVTRVDPTPITGGNMWQNRDWTKNIPGQQLPGLHRDGCASYVVENGKDVGYIGAANQYSTQIDLYRFQLNDVNQPTLDQVAKVGSYYSGSDGTKTCGYDGARKLFVRSGTNTTPFFFWDLTNPGPSNFDQTVQVESTISAFSSWLAAQQFDMHNCALAFDPGRGDYPIWCGGPTIWRLKEPPANTTSGWTVVQQPAPTTGSPSTAVQALDIMGKWRYAQYYDVFIALENEFDGNVWVYKPIGWNQPNPPGNALPTVSLLTPAGGSTVVPGATVNLTSQAQDSDGSIARVVYYVNGLNVGQATSPPYTVPIQPVQVGSYTVIAVAVDNVGGMGKSTPVTFNVNATLTTTVLQRGLNGYAGAADTYLDNTNQTTPHGTNDPIWLDQSNYNPLVRFAIFQSEGGPVPNGAVLQSATLSIYKQQYSDALQLNSLLVPWTEADATWTNRLPGVPWSMGGAANPGVDYLATPDALLASPNYNPGLVAFDVTARVQQWSNGTATNYGWRMAQASAGINPKQFTSSEDATVSARPQLTLVWSGGSVGNTPPTVSITSPTNPATITLGASVTLQASASDNGTVTQVVYSVNGSPISGALTTAPYTFTWTPAAVGTYNVIATATDNQGATGTSAPVTVNVNPVSNGTTVVLQRGLNGYAGVTDTFLDSQLQTTVRGSMDPLYLDVTKYNPLVRFSIFQSEGGPVPNGATIQSATLSLYKQLYGDTIRVNALLKPWVESQATWLVSQTGVPWTSPGASGSGTDFASAADALVAAPYNAGWVNFDVTTRVQQWSGGPSTNFGWRLSQTTTGYNPKTFNSSEYAADTTHRPMLTVVYTGGSSNKPPTVSIATPSNGASITLGAGFSLTANASDPDGTVAKVEYFANGTSVGSSTNAASQFPVSWTPGATGGYTLTAVATDNVGATTTSAGIGVSVNPVSNNTTVVLQRGLNGYVGVADTFLDSQLQTTVRGSMDPLYLDVTKYMPLVRFAIYQSEGGPVPNGAIIVSATLSLNKGLYSDTIQLNPLLKPWVESQTTWLNSQTGVPWASPGASTAGVDFATPADATVAAAYAAGWVDFDVTSRVQQWALSAPGVNQGWRLSQTTSGYNPKTFHSSEYTTDTTLRPKLTVVYH
jgi:hypothetical protein